MNSLSSVKPLRYNTVNSITYKDFQRTKCMSVYKNVHITYVIKFHSRDRPQNYWTFHLTWNFFSHFSIGKDSWEYLAFHILVFHGDIETVIFKGLRTRRITIQLRFHADIEQCQVSCSRKLVKAPICYLCVTLQHNLFL